MVSRPPWKSATTALGPRLEKRRVSRLQSVIAMALRVGGYSEITNLILYNKLGHRTTNLFGVRMKYPG